MKSDKNPDPAQMSLATQAIHGTHLHAYKGPVSTPIVQSSTYRFDSSDDATRYAAGDPSVYVYSRYHNPTVAEVQDRLALMMRTEKAILFSSGMAAITSAILSCVKSGDEIISTPSLYGGTFRYFREILPGQHIMVHYLSPDQLDQISSMASPKTRVVYFETPTNPSLGIVDIEKIISETRKAEKKTGTRIITIIDNTFASVLNQNPVRFGVDLIVESATKYLGGHSDIIAGVVAGSEELLAKVHTQLKYYGGCADPFAAYLLYRSLKTFELRVIRQNENAMALAKFLEGQTNVLRVLYPGLPSHPQHLIARKQMVEAGGKGYGGMVTMEVKGGVKGAVAVADALRVAVNAMSLGGVETLVSIPVYSSHINMSDAELASHGVSAGMVRISVGVEGIEDLKQDFDRALQSIKS